MNDIKHWSNHKKRLAKKGLINPLFMNLHRLSFKRKSNLASAFEPLLIARHAQRLGELIERCLAIRKDIRELEILEVKAATDYDLFNSTSAIDEQIEVLRLQMPSKGSDQAGFDKAIAAFSTQSTLEKGLSEIAKGRSGALADDVNDSTTIRDLTHTRWQSLRDYQNAYHARYTQPGNAHNYGERAKLLLDVLTVLMQEALGRAAALAGGIQQVYGTLLAGAPVSVDLQSLDEFAVWALKTLQSLSRAAEQETVSEIIIPLVQPWLPSEEPLIKQADFDDSVSGAANGAPISLSFKFPNNGLLDPRTRLKSIGVSFGNKTYLVPGSGIDRNQIVDTFTRLTLTVNTPAQTKPDGKSYLRPPLLIGNAGLHGAGGGNSMLEGNSIENLSPFGMWSINIHPLIVWKDGSKRLVSETNDSDIIRDLKIALRFYIPGDIQ